jgi:hypothetical protein
MNLDIPTLKFTERVPENSKLAGPLLILSILGRVCTAYSRANLT